VVLFRRYLHPQMSRVGSSWPFGSHSISQGCQCQDNAGGACKFISGGLLRNDHRDDLQLSQSLLSS